MEIIYFIIFFIVSYLMLMRIFGYSTYHKYFWKALPILVLYSATVGYLLYYFEFHGGFFWQILLTIISLTYNQRKQNHQFAEVFNSINDLEKIKLFTKSERNTKKYFWLSATIYLIIFSIAYTINNIEIVSNPIR